jgi:molecular chaperone DnaK (HSP70)
MAEGNEGSIEVRSTDGDAHLGGKDIDQKIIDWLAVSFKRRAALMSAKTRSLASASTRQQRKQNRALNSSRD